MRGDQSTEALLAEFDAMLRTIAEEAWDIAAIDSTQLQRKGQLAEAANKLRPLARKILAAQKRRSGETLHRPAA